MEERERQPDRTIIVTGAASGIGRAVSLRFGVDGYRVVLVDLKREGLAETAALLPPAAQQAMMLIQCDIRDEAQVNQIAASVLERFGTIDILVHCAGILRSRGSGPKLMMDVSLEEWQQVIDVNLKGTFLCNRAVVPAMIRQRCGQIINLSSTSGKEGRAFDSVYCASKFGVIGLSHSLAEEVRSYGIKVHVILPAAVDTPMWEQNGPLKAPDEALPPERIADLIVFLVGMPPDTILGDIVIRPFKARRRKKESINGRNP